MNEKKDLFAGEVDRFKTENGVEIAFYSIKHATIAIEVSGKWIYVDAVTKGAEPETDFTDMPKADCLLFTHDHYDHFDTDAVAQLSKEGTEIIGNQSVIDTLGCGKALKNGESAMVFGEWKLEAVPAYNTSDEKLDFHPKGRDNGYILTIDGLRTYIAGDCEPIEEMSEIKDIDIAFLPCNLPFTMTPEQCAEAARIVKPAVLFPYHYGDTQINRVADLLEGSGMDVRIRSYR